MKILHFTSHLTPSAGGPATSVRALHQNFPSAGFQSKLCVRKEVGGYVDVDVFQFKSLGPKKINFWPSLINDVDKLVKESDIVSGHLFYQFQNYAFSRSAFKNNVPLVYHPHGSFDPWILASPSYPRKLAKFLFEDTNFKRVSAWRALTETEADQIRNAGFKQPIIVCPNGVDVLKIEEAIAGRENKPHDHKTVIFFGRLHEKKGLDWLISAWKKIGKEFPEWKLKIAGPVEESGLKYLAELQKMQKVEYLGVLSGMERMHALADADIFVLPSKSEGLPMAVLEAMSCGLPVVVTEACNCQFVKETGCGSECSNDEVSFAKSLSEVMLLTDEQRKIMGQLGNKLVKDKFSWQNVVSNLAEFYRSL